MKLYLAGPLFSTADKEFNLELDRWLRVLGYETWLPQLHEPREYNPHHIFYKDVEGIEWADAVVACMDGADPDSGTCWECGYAYAKGMPILCYRTDFRNGGDTEAGYNLMMWCSATYLVSAVGKSSKELAYCINDCLNGR